MAAKAKKESGWGAFIFGLFIIGLAVTVALIPLAHLERTYIAEREAVQSLLGDAEQEIYEHSYSDSSDEMRDGISAVTQDFGKGKPVSEWVQERMSSLMIWSNLISYRLTMLLAWLLSFLPLIIAAFVDGYYVREARKYSFFSQSPIRHKVGIRSATAVFIVALLSIGVPLVIPPLLVPISLIGIGLAGWLWISNLQKRL